MQHKIYGLFFDSNYRPFPVCTIDYKVEPVHLPGKQFTVSLSHSGSPSLMVAFHNQMDMMKWFECLEAATKTVPEQKNSEPVKQEIAEKPEKVLLQTNNCSCIITIRVPSLFVR